MMNEHVHVLLELETILSIVFTCIPYTYAFLGRYSPWYIFVQCEVDFIFHCYIIYNTLRNLINYLGLRL